MHDTLVYHGFCEIKHIQGGIIAMTQYPPGIIFSNMDLLKFVITQAQFDPVQFARQMSDEYGGFARNKFGTIEIFQIADPELAHEVLVQRTAEFYKGNVMYRVLKPFLGNGLLTSEGDFWKRQRKLAQPAFHYKRIASYADTMIEHTQKLLHDWRVGETRMIDREMMKVTLSIVNKTLFNVDISAEADRIGEAMNVILHAADQNMNAVVALPAWIPTPQRLHQKRMVAQLDAIIQQFITERRQSQHDNGDLLSMLLLAQDDDGQGMSDQQLRDEVITMFLAGHETTANALMWTFYLLSQHADIKQRLYAEIDSVLGERTVTLQDLPNMPYLDMVLKESMRLFPPVAAVSRSPYADMELGGYRLPKDAIMQISIFAMHRSTRYWHNPDVFDPERFSPENEAKIPRYAYLPFGGGARVCIGNQFAIMEAKLLLVTIMQQYELDLAPNHEVVPQQLLTLRAKHGMKMVIRHRQTQAVATV
jgi:cytochrome P450